MRALIVVDVQKDFCEGGALAVSGGDLLAEKIADYINSQGHRYDEIVFTKDWHRPLPDTNGGHFSDNPDYVDTWPPHCVMLTDGAKFHPKVYELIYDGRVDAVDRIFYKGGGVPAYSGFQGYNRHALKLGDYLRMAHIADIDVIGIAGDYCVKQTAMDGLVEGFNVKILPDLVVSIGGPEASMAAAEEIENNQTLRDGAK